MSIAQNEKISQVKEEPIVVLVDIASETHYARAFDYSGVELGRVFKFDSNSEGFGQFSEWGSKLIAESSSGKYRGQTRISKCGRKILRYALFQVVNPLIRF